MPGLDLEGNPGADEQLERPASKRHMKRTRGIPRGGSGPSRSIDRSMRGVKEDPAETDQWPCGIAATTTPAPPYHMYD
jgi:hypothetical protein